jgi:hypothetical protein
VRFPLGLQLLFRTLAAAPDPPLSQLLDNVGAIGFIRIRHESPQFTASTRYSPALYTAYPEASVVAAPAGSTQGSVTPTSGTFGLLGDQQDPVVAGRDQAGTTAAVPASTLTPEKPRSVNHHWHLTTTIITRLRFNVVRRVGRGEYCHGRSGEDR